ncbi:MAG TPA: GAF domain-containing protein, partial [Methylomirabilota bacterium]|nr:GAF domain-containing protein [Methylomirabilota bacterium]
SPTDVQPVFDAIVRSAVRLCGASHGGVYRFDGVLVHSVAHAGFSPEQLEQWRKTWPRPASANSSLACEAIRTRRIARVRDIEATASVQLTTEARGNLRSRGSRSVLAVPMISHDAVVGVIGLAHPGVDAFSDAHVELLQTFADQAVIAIENVRLFNETKEALDRQTATSEILQVISASRTDVQPVFDAIVTSAAHLCSAEVAVVLRLTGDQLHLAAHWNTNPEWIDVARREYPMPADEGISGLALRERRVVHVPDIEADDRFPFARRLARTMGYRSIVFVPMLHEGVAVGTIGVGTRVPFSESQIELLRTFADQAVIAIENVRLVTELQVRTQELTRSVGQLTALGEVGRAVSSTLDLETVLSTIVSRAIQLSGTDGGSVYEYDEATEEFSLRASRDLPEAYVEEVRDTRPRKGEGAVGRVAQTREPVQIADISDPAAYESRVRNTLLQIGLRALLAVPLIAEDQLVGALIVMRKRMGTFAAEEVALLQTFATQSALAIQNARLFREIEDKSRQLEVASQHKSEFLANMSHELRTPLNAIIGFSEVLAEKMFGELNEKQEEYSKDIHASGQHLLSLINDILDLSKIEAGRMELELSDFHLPTALDSALTLVRERAGRRSIALHLSIDEQLGQIQADERKARQVVLNLLSNAIKFTPEGGRIEVKAEPRDGSVEVSVADTGVSIAPEDQEAVFEEFRQVGTADKKVEGTGLGLTLCRKFVELHGGRIWVKSQVGVGSTFTFTIPVRTT